VSFLKAARAQDGHPANSSPLDEQVFLVSTINFLQTLPQWNEMAVIIAWDDSDGWYDHVLGPIVNQSTSSADALSGAGACGTGANSLAGIQSRCGYGPRLPLVVVSPFAKENFVDGTITDHIPPGMQRVLTRLGETPVAVYAADWRLIWWNRSWAALLGDPSVIAPQDRSLIKSRFPVAGERGEVATSPVVSANREASDRAIVADLRRASARYPHDQRLAALIRRALDGSPRFAKLWHDGAVGGHAEDRKTIRHPDIGEITVDCDVLNDSDTDLKIVIYTSATGSEDATKLDLARLADIRPA